MNQPQWAPLPAPPTPPPAPYFVPPSAPLQKPSGLYKALGIVMAALGAAGVLYALFSIVTSIALTSRLSGAAFSSDPLAIAFIYGRLATNVLTGALLVASGIGVFRAKAWSRLVGIGYAAISLGATLVGTAVSVLVIQPRTYGHLGATSAARSVQSILIATQLFSMVIACALPSVVLVMLLIKRARAELDQ